MTDHETFLLLAAKQISERLTEEEEAALTEHLASCPSCRATMNAMRRDDIMLRGELAATSVSPRVRRRVLEEAAGVRRIDWRVPLAAAATLLIAVVGVPLIVGGRPPDVAPSTPSPAASVAQASPTASDPVSPLATESLGPSVSPPPPTSQPSASGDGPYVAGSYVYGTGVPRRDTIAAHFEGTPVGEWSRTVPATGEGNFYGGPITCLVIERNEAWLAGLATTATDGTKNGAVFIHVIDGGPEGAGDRAYQVMNTRAQTLTTMEEWCLRKFVPAPPYPLISGDIVVDDGL